LEPVAFFEALGVRYTGPIDGHDIAGLERAFADAAEYDGPIVVHVLTHKGRGYQPAEDDDEQCLHDVSVFDPSTGPVRSSESTVSYTDAFAKAIIEAGERDPKVVAITAAMPGPTGLLSFEERFPDRCIDVGIAEQHAVTAAAGMAMGGLHPVAAIYSTFLCRAFDQVTYDVGLHGEKVLFCIDRAGITGENGASHHGVLDLALLRTVPGMTIFAPSSARELEVMVRDALELCDGPAAIRYPRGAARLVPPGDTGTGFEARRLREGDDVCILAVGKLVDASLGAASLLATEGIEATVWDVRLVKPLDRAMLADAARHQLIVTAEDGIRIGGAGSAIIDALAEMSEGRPVPPVVTLGTPGEFIAHGKASQILADLGLDDVGIAAAVIRALAPARTS
jgi:1-deoxy-D-xylulose-5-phosphate synthase